MSFNDWRDYTDQTAYTPEVGKIGGMINLFSDFKYEVIRPFNSNIVEKLKVIDNVAFVVYWLKDVLMYIDFYFPTQVQLYLNLNELNKQIKNGNVTELNTSQKDFTAGDIIILGVTNEWDIDTGVNYLSGIFISENQFLTFIEDGLYKDSLINLLNKYPAFNFYTTFRI